MSDHAAPTETPPKRSSKMKMGLIVGAIVLAQCGLAYFLLPAAAEPAAAEKEKEKDKGGHDEKHGDEHAQEYREAELGAFSLTAFDATSNTTMLIDFHLYGIVAEDPPKEGEEDAHGGGHGHGAKGPVEDTSEFGKLFAKHKQRFRDAVIVTIRNSELADLTDPGLGLIKRQILAKTNALLGEPLLKEVVFSDFAVVEQ